MATVVDGASADGTGTGVVPVAVPREYLPDVYALLGRLMSNQSVSGDLAHLDEVSCPHCRSSAYLWGSGAYRCGECGLTFRLGPEPGAIEIDHENGCWTEKMVRRLKTELQSPIAVGAVTAIAKRAPGTVSTDELVELLAVEPNQLRAELAVLSKTSKRLFGRRMWPMSARQGWGEGSRMGYRMPERVAEWWMAAPASDLGPS